MYSRTLVLFICSAMFVACKKDYTCKCTATLNVPGFGTISADTVYVISKTTKKKAKNTCADSDRQLKAEAQANGGTASCSVQ